MPVSGLEGRLGDLELAPRSTRIADGILATIGRTPLVRLRQYLPAAGFHLFAKLEALNPGGSIKDRPAVAILEDGLASGAIGPDTVIVESSSGNMGIGLAQACRYHGLQFICVVDAKTTAQNIAILRAYGADIEVVLQPDPETGELLPARLERVAALVREIGDAFWPNQYANLLNPREHYRSTMREVAAALDDRVDYLFIAVSTCGTLRGCCEHVRDRKLATRVFAVDAVGSVVFGGCRSERLIPGLGAGLQPPLWHAGLVDECIHVTDAESIAGCRRLVAREAILAGGSSGSVMAAIEKTADRLAAGANCVAILPDRGERYLETIYDDAWVGAHFGRVEQPHLARGGARATAGRQQPVAAGA
ncbi:MAG TPA: 2,3-diaminopropionate biosynthesis protein SbnA [Thermoanaerobaculia bacterium]|nr:2,3-diaminopropionate biosynthesis protein SbnA [Thermoanaerobaculia bacterium]